MDEPDVKLMRERKYPLFVDRTVDGALERANCQKTSKQKGYRKMMKDSESSGYYNGKKTSPLWAITTIKSSKNLLSSVWVASSKGQNFKSRNSFG